jgi:hypothetical protein
MSDTPQRPRHVYNVDRALKRLANELDRFETRCVLNGLFVRSVKFSNNPKREWSDLKFHLVPIE